MFQTPTGRRARGFTGNHNFAKRETPRRSASQTGLIEDSPNFGNNAVVNNVESQMSLLKSLRFASRIMGMEHNLKHNLSSSQISNFLTEKEGPDSVKRLEYIISPYP